jgi:hypothetical protein
MKSRNMRFSGHVARKGEEKRVYRVWMKNPSERGHFEDRGVDRRMGSE